MTIKEAAAYAGYRSTSTLKRAAASGELRTEQPAKTLRLTTKAWVDEYVQRHTPPEGKPGKGHRGKPRKEPS
jgi:hypothetical protein